MKHEGVQESLQPDYFDNVYNANDDPWNFSTSNYEAEKYAATLAALPHEKYESAFEIGCSIGILTAQLALRCHSLLAVDVNEKALQQARERCRKLSHVRFNLMQIPKDFPSEKFDLVIVSEVGYYLSVKDWQLSQAKIVTHLNPDGIVCMVHWTHFVADYPQTGNAVHNSFAEWSKNKLQHLQTECTADYRLDVWQKR